MRKVISLLTIFITTSIASTTALACNNHPKLLRVVDINQVLTEKDLGSIYTGGMPIPIIAELEDAIIARHHDIKINALSLEKITNNSVKVSGDGVVYTGSKTVGFTVKDKVPITDIISKGMRLKTTVQTEGKPVPNKNDIITALKSEYTDVLNTDAIIVESNIERNSAIITGNGITYVGSVKITFGINRTIQLDKVITNPKLGIILTHGKDKPSADDIKKSLSEKYPTLCTDKIDITEITSTSAIVKSNSYPIYTPKPIITLSFTTDKHLDFDKVLINHNLGQIHVDNNHKKPSVAQIKTALTANNLNPELNVDYIVINEDKIQENGALISSKDQKIYQGKPIKVQYQIDRSDDLAKIITNPKLGIFKFLPRKTIPEFNDIFDKLKSYSLQKDKIDISKITKTSAILSSRDQNVYTGSVKLTYTVDNSVPLNSVLTNTDLKTINTNGMLIVSKDLIIKTIISNNRRLNSEYITVDKITDHSAVVNGDNTHYIGSITVTFKIDNKTISNSLAYNHSKAITTWKQPGSRFTFDGEEITILKNWDNYAKNWNDFAAKFPKLSFGENALLRVWMETCDSRTLKGDQLTANTSIITTDQNKAILEAKFHYEFKPVWPLPKWVVDLSVSIIIWHDNHNVYLNWHGTSVTTTTVTRDSQYAINLPEVIFHQ